MSAHHLICLTHPLVILTTKFLECKENANTPFRTEDNHEISNIIFTDMVVWGSWPSVVSIGNITVITDNQLLNTYVRAQHVFLQVVLLFLTGLYDYFHAQALCICHMSHYCCSPLGISTSLGVWMVSTLMARIEGSPRCCTG